MRNAALPAVLLALLGGAGTTAAQTITTLVLNDADVPPYGSVYSIDGFAARNGGEWAAELRLWGAATYLIVDADGPVLGWQDPVPGVSGAVIEAVWGPLLDGLGGTGLIGSWDEAGELTSGLFHDGALVLQGGDPLSAPTLPAGSTVDNLWAARRTPTGYGLVNAGFHEPTWKPGAEQQVLLKSIGTTPGAMLWFVVAKEGDTMPGTTAVYSSLPTSWNPYEVALSDTGEVMYTASGSAPEGSVSVVYRNTELLAASHMPSPVAGRNWDSLVQSTVDINAAGSFVYTGELEGDSATAFVLVKDGVKYRQSGDTLPAIAPYTLERIGEFFGNPGPGTARIDAFGNVLWWGEWDDPDTSKNTGLFYNDTLIVQTGVSTTSDGDRITALYSSNEASYELTDDGRHVYFRGTINGTTGGLFRLELPFGGVQPMASCGAFTSGLNATGGLPLLGQTLDLTLDAPPGPGALPFVALSLTPAAGWPPCGLAVPGIGEVLLDLATPPAAVLSDPGSVGLPTTFAVPIPADGSLIGVDVYAQGLYLDLSLGAAEPIRLSNGLILTPSL